MFFFLFFLSYSYQVCEARILRMLHRTGSREEEEKNQPISKFEVLLEEASTQ